MDALCSNKGAAATAPIPVRTYGSNDATNSPGSASSRSGYTSGEDGGHPYNFGQQSSHGKRKPRDIDEEQCQPMLKIFQHQQRNREEDGGAQQVHEGLENEHVIDQQEEEDDNVPLQVEVHQQPQLQRVSTCDSCVIAMFLFMLLACIGLVVYTGVMVNEVNSEHSIWLSTTENFSLNNYLTHGQLNWYTKELCIKKLSHEYLDHYVNDHVVLSLRKKPCRDVRREYAQREIIKTSMPYHGSRFSFFWFSGTKVRFKVSIKSNSTDDPESYFQVYILDTDDEWLECQRHILHNFETQVYRFNFNGDSNDYVNCDEENGGFVCLSSPYHIRSTQRYHICTQFSSEGDDGHHNMTFHLLTNGTGYHSGLCDGNVCQLNQTDCCISYDSFFHEMYEPTCVFIQSNTLGSSSEANELSFPLTITSHKRWDAVVYSGILGVAVLTLLVLSFSCVLGKIRYQKTHPNQYCVEMKIFGRNCLQL